MTEPCTHPRGSGCAFCPDCGDAMDTPEMLLWFLRECHRKAKPGFSGDARPYCPHPDKMAAWVERKIAEEKSR